MSITQSIAQSDSSADLSSEELERGIEAIIGRANAVAAPPPIPRPVGPKAGGRGDLWGPSSPPVTSPLQLLAQVADHAVQLQQQMMTLVTAITGEAAPAPRLRQAPLRSNGLLPQIAIIAHEIEETHLMTARLIEHVRGRL